MNPYILESKLFERFEQAVSDHDDFLINLYENHEGKNKWNIICSAKDWLHVSIYGLPYIDIDHSNDDYRSLTVLQLITTYDLVLQSVEQLHRVFEIKLPFEDDRSIFRQLATDDNYFKQIRACFGAHPVNLTSSNGVPNHTKNKRDQEKFFASWSSNVGQSDYTTYLNSNTPGSEPIKFTLQFKNLHEYITKRYHLLSNLIDVIEQKKKDHHQSQRKKKIDRSPDTVEQLQILLQENSKRFLEGSGYHHQIQELYKLFTAPQHLPQEDKDLASKYLVKLKPLVDEIYSALQSMENKDLDHNYLLEYDTYKLKESRYYISKILEYLNNPYFNDLTIHSYLRPAIDIGLLPVYVDEETDKRDLMLLLLSKLDNRIEMNDERNEQL